MVLLFKGGGRPYDKPGSYRSISLIDSIAKLYERMVLHRLEAELSELGGLSIRQFDFREGVGTTEAIDRVMELSKEGKLHRDERACAIVAMDVANAFNSALWPAIDNAVRRRGFSRHMVELLRSYMTDREIQVAPSTVEGILRLDVRAGVPQSSVLGPTLWNILMTRSSWISPRG